MNEGDGEDVALADAVGDMLADPDPDPDPDPEPEPDADPDAVGAPFADADADTLADAEAEADAPPLCPEADTDGENIAGCAEDGEDVQAAAAAATPTAKAAAPATFLAALPAAPARVVRTFMKPPTECLSLATLSSPGCISQNGVFFIRLLGYSWSACCGRQCF